MAKENRTSINENGIESRWIMTRPYAFDPNQIFEVRAILMAPGVHSARNATALFHVRGQRSRGSKTTRRTPGCWWEEFSAQNECRADQFEEHDIPFHGASINLRPGSSYGLRWVNLPSLTVENRTRENFYVKSL